ncbi:DNA repair protein Rhp26/Rad26/DNA repair and recombination protein RAD26 [Blumeria hordei DH14]|uniref:DNA repair protein Rhp26/Rad26/DNA repair and recombination protein RAD26 n=1 Tax=Blumeria graminis f. sp. hordei (strain DH14) TaxID=546991 RepID=N1JK09_BLUG1|nr:DNA repair protein Rhp26/Rad26/DNA repair and recombination protein RAD26 [Blumeria hordei DH14]
MDLKLHCDSFAVEAETPISVNIDDNDMSTNNGVGIQHDITEAEKTDGTGIADESSVLKNLTADVRDQDDLERDISNQACRLITEQENDRDQKRIEKSQVKLEKLLTQEKSLKRRLDVTANNLIVRNRCLQELEKIEIEVNLHKKDIEEIQCRIEQRHCDDLQPKNVSADSSNIMPNETRKDFLIRTGKITPFSKIQDQELDNADGSHTKATINAHIEADHQTSCDPKEPRSHQHLRLPGFMEVDVEDEFSLRPRKKRKLDETKNMSNSMGKSSSNNDDFIKDSFNDHSSSDSQYNQRNNSKISKKRSAQESNLYDNTDLTGIDDGNESMYQKRLEVWVEKRSKARLQNKESGEKNTREKNKNNVNEEEWFKPCPNVLDYDFGNGLSLPGDIHPALFEYQKTGVQWLGELYNQQVGGIIGDEMGLGKTIQTISFLAGLHYSKKLSKPIIVVAPATVLRQWVNEFHKWWPPMRVSILHSSGSGMVNVRNENISDYEEDFNRARKKSPKKVQKIVHRVIQHGHVLVTTYAGLQTYADVLIPVNWGYAVLDEGHKIRNPNTAITIYCKELKTPHRIILSGTPMQNNLIELWSLFDFVFPMRLGTLIDFRQTFETPIKQGGYANSTNLQVLAATKCAETLKTTISPYLLQRLKVDVASDLPKKTEQASEEMASIMNRTRQSLYGIDILKKICNHPDLLDPHLKVKPGYKWANPNKSGKMKIVESLLSLWKKFGHKTLLFCQGVQMLDILEDLIKDNCNYNYLRMDGGTNIKDRQTLVDQFNSDPNLHVFLLTTKVGGLGVNLTGANRVIIFDPDWNPSTDVQARERAWRLGQKKEVTIYRLITAGTIEEKMYHRQIFKQFLTNKVLKDPKQRQTFQMKDLYDLFSLADNDGGTTETGVMFEGTEVQYQTTPTRSDQVHCDQGPTQERTEECGQGDLKPEVCNLDGVAGLETYRGNSQEEIPKSQEARLMEGIFAGSGVQGALEHDQIINGKKKITADRGIIEREAKKIAALAAAQLRKAGEVARELVPGTVTWTGEHGSAGRPANIRYARALHSDVITGLANHQQLLDRSSLAEASSRASTRPTGNRDFVRLIQCFIRRQGGSVPSQALVNHFNRMCQTPEQTDEFKHKLREIARLEVSKRNGARGIWFLKDEYK